MVGYITKPINQEEMLKTILEKTARKHVRRTSSSAAEKADSGTEDIPGVSIKDILSSLSFDIDTVKEILASFLEINRSTIEELKGAYHAGNLHNLWRMAHTLKGASSNIRAYALQHAAEELEDKSCDLLETENISALDSILINNIEVELEIVLHSISDYLGIGKTI